MKYFVLGAFSSAFLLYGIAMVYGATGSTNLVDIRSFLAIARTLLHDGMLLLGFALLLVGLGFKIAAVPFHSWSPDVYQGAPTPSVAFMAAAVKAASFAALLRVFVVGLRALQRRLAAGGLRSCRGHPSRRFGRWRSCRPTSSACWPTPRSATPDSCSSAWRPRPAKGTAS